MFMNKYTLYIYIVTIILSLNACSTNGIVEENPTPQPTGTESNDPMLFSAGSESMSSQTRTTTRAAALQNGFIVSTFKGYGSSLQSTVMDKYVVDYKETRDDWNGVVISNWNYIGTYNGVVQAEKYWDYANFPYRFHAVAYAHPSNTETYPSVSGISDLGASHLLLNKVFKSQTFEAPAGATPTTSITPTDGEAEPYIIAQVSRDANGTDLDLLTNKTDKTINTSSTSKNRRVSLPFHHLNCKVRFAIYTDNLGQTDRSDYIKDLTIWADKQATSATSYEAHGEGSWVSLDGFSNFTGITVVDRNVLYKFNTGGTGRTYEQNDLFLHPSKNNAYFLECPNGIMQLPQENVKMHVSLTIMKGDGSGATAEYHDFEITAPDTGSANFNPLHWKAGNIYTYYLHLTFDDINLPIITATCTLTPWEDVSGSLITDLEE